MKGFKIAKLHDMRLSFMIDLSELKDKIMDHITAQDKNILEVSCKTGIMTIKVAKEIPHSQITGMEYNQQFLRLAKRRKRKSFLKNVEFMNLSNLTLCEKEFDVVILFFALNELSVDSIKQLLDKIKLILKYQKKLIIVDYMSVTKRFFRLIWKIYHKIFSNKHFESFISYDLCEILHNLGYHPIVVEEYDNVKIISSHNNGE